MLTPSIVTQAASVGSLMLAALEAWGDGSSSVSFGARAAAIFGPIVKVSVSPALPSRPSAVGALHADGTVSVYLPGVQTAAQAASFLAGGLPPSGFFLPLSTNTVVQLYAQTAANLLAALVVPSRSSVFVTGFSLGGAAAYLLASNYWPSVADAGVCVISVGAPKPGSPGDYRTLTRPPVWRFWLRADPVVALPPAIPDAPIACAAAGPVVAFNWNRQAQPVGGLCVDPSGFYVNADGGRTNTAINAVSLARLLWGGAASPANTHSLLNYVNVLAAVAASGAVRAPSADEQLRSIKPPVVALAAVPNAIASAIPQEFPDRSLAMVPRVIIPAGEFPTVVPYLDDWAVLWQGQLVARFASKYMAKILRRWIADVMRRSSLADGLDQAAWTAAVTSWTANLQAVGSGYSPQPPAF